VGGHYLLYLPKYTAPDNPLQRLTDEEIEERWLKNLEMMFPRFDRRWVRHFFVNRAPYVEPIHP
jgi:protoporphyrinogen oxidase